MGNSSLIAFFLQVLRRASSERGHYMLRIPPKIISVCLSKLKIALWPPGESHPRQPVVVGGLLVPVVEAIEAAGAGNAVAGADVFIEAGVVA